MSLSRRGALGLAAAALVAACERGPVARAPFTDAAGRAVALPARVRKVFPAGPPAAVMLYTLAPDLMAGWPKAPPPAAKAFLAAPGRDLPEIGRLTGRGNTANLEAVLAAAPDIIFDIGGVDETHATLADRVQTQTRIPYLLMDGGFSKAAPAYRALGAIVGREERAGQLAAYADSVTADVESRKRNTDPEDRPRVYYGRGPEGLETGLAGSINVEVLDAVGARNVATGGAGRGGGGGLGEVSLEQILAWDPDVILTLDKAFQAKALSDPRFAGLRAVKSRRVHRAPALPFGWFDSPPGVNRLIGARWLLEVLYPQPGAADRIRGAALEFYALFYQVSPTPAQLDTLLEGALPG